MQVNNESTFQSWIIKNLLPFMHEGLVVRSDSNNRNGVSDLIWVVPDIGVLAMELKYSKTQKPHLKMLSHKLSSLQGRFLQSWGEASGWNKSLVLVGTESRDLLVFSGDNINHLHVNDMSINDARQAADIIIMDIVGAGYNRLQDRYKDVSSLMNFMGLT